MTLSHLARLTQATDGAIQLAMTIETQEGTTPQDFRIRVSKGRNGNLKISVDDTTYWPHLSSVDQPFSMYVPGLSGIAPSEAYMTPAGVHRAAARGHGNVVLRNVLWQLSREPEKWNRFQTHLGQMFDGHEVEVEHEPQTSELVDAFIRTGTTRHPLGLAGTGLLQSIQILAYMNLYIPGLLLLDEPDSHLHPDKQLALLELVTTWAEEVGARVVIATHSRHLIRALHESDCLFWMREGEATAVAGRDDFALLTELGALDVGDRLRNGTTQLLVLTEDSGTPGKMRFPLIRCLLNANGVDTDHAEFVSYAGASNSNAAKALVRFSTDVAPGTSVVVHRDRDYKTEDEIALWSAQIRQSGAIPFVTRGTDIESYFIDPDHVATVQNVDVEVARQWVISACDAARVKTESALADQVQQEMARENRESGSRNTTPNPASVMKRVRDRIDADPIGSAHGKHTLKALRSILHQQGRAPAATEVASVHLRDEPLAELAALMTSG